MSLFATVLLLALSCTAAFSGIKPTARRQSRLFLAVQPPPTVLLTNTAVSSPSSYDSMMSTSPSMMSTGIDSYLTKTTTTTSTTTTTTSVSLDSSFTVALDERVAPTKDEIAAKKRNFNVLFWGGGFVAPFLATFFYFGFKFWER